MKKTLLQVLFFASLLLAGCKGKDGDPGPTGATGDTGANGAKGDTGSNGVGFDNATKDGDVAVTFSGKRPDNVNFNAAQDFKYQLDASSPGDDSYVYKNQNDGSMEFYVVRYLGAVDQHYNENYVEIQFTVSSTNVVTLGYINVQTSIIDGTKYFGVVESDSGTALSISNYSYDSATGTLKFNFGGTYTASNSTGYDLTVAGVANVKVYESLNNN